MHYAIYGHHYDISFANFKFQFKCLCTVPPIKTENTFELYAEVEIVTKEYTFATFVLNRYMKIQNLKTKEQTALHEQKR